MSIFSEHELTFTFAIQCMSSSVRLSFVCLSVTFVHPTQAIEIFGNISTPFATLRSPLPLKYGHASRAVKTAR